MNALTRVRQQLSAQARLRWQALSPREQRIVAALGALVGLLLFWAVAIAPAYQTMHDSERRRTQINQQQAQMLALQAQAQALQSHPFLSREEALRNLQKITPSPQIQLHVQGERVAAQLKGVPAAALANWLAQARDQVQALPVEAHLTRPSASNATTPAPTTALVWDGSVVLHLPNRDATR